MINIHDNIGATSQPNTSSQLIGYPFSVEGDKSTFKKPLSLTTEDLRYIIEASANLSKERKVQLEKDSFWKDVIELDVSLKENVSPNHSQLETIQQRVEKIKSTIGPFMKKVRAELSTALEKIDEFDFDQNPEVEDVIELGDGGQEIIIGPGSMFKTEFEKTFNKIGTGVQTFFETNDSERSFFEAWREASLLKLIKYFGHLTSKDLVSAITAEYSEKMIEQVLNHIDPTSLSSYEINQAVIFDVCNELLTKIVAKSPPLKWRDVTDVYRRYSSNNAGLREPQKACKIIIALFQKCSKTDQKKAIDSIRRYWKRESIPLALMREIHKNPTKYSNYDVLDTILSSMYKKNGLSR